MNELKTLLDESGQGHVYEITGCFAKMEEGASHPVVQQLLKLNLKDSIKHCKAAHEVSPSHDADYRPISTENLITLQDIRNHPEMRELGIRAIQNNEVAAIIMSGGQGTRLGFHGPKGMYDIGLSSHKTIFQLHVEKLLKLISLYTLPSSAAPRIPLYVMTSDLNHDIIIDYFTQHEYFGYPKEDVFFFEQNLLPCFDFDNKVIVESVTSLALAPDGNGGVYRALSTSPLHPPVAASPLEDMTRRGVKHLHIYGVDNVLSLPLDPVFLGGCIQRAVEVGNKVVWREEGEKVGVTVEWWGKKDGAAEERQKNSRMCIIEYSEIPASLASAHAADGKLLFGAGNICSHYIGVDFLVQKVLPSLSETYHLAPKKIPFYDATSRTTVTPSSPNGVKLELFVFDVFPLADRWVVVEADRGEEFAPVKNAPGSATDSPDTARRLLTLQAVRWLQKVGAKVEVPEGSKVGDGDCLCEISPLLSNQGEGLEKYAGQTIRLPAYLH